MHLVIPTRADPRLPLARLRAHGHLIEIRANDLRFSHEETTLFLDQAMGLSLSNEEITVLGKRTEGWIAGLQIAGLSMQGHADIPEFIRAFSGSHRHILGYLADEVLNQRPKGTMNFLLQTSILDRLCGPLCDVVTGGSDGQAILENLAQANLFITPLDDEGMWYRYHHLFAEVLQARLEQTNRDLVSDLHHRAGDWYASQGMIDEAVRHSLAGGNFEGASRLIDSVAGILLRKGSGTSLSRWLDALPEQTVRTHPRLSLARGWTIFMGPGVNLEHAETWALLALRIARENKSIDSDLTGEVAALRSMIAITRGEVAKSRKFAQEALTDLAIDSPWRSAVTFSLATTNLEFGDISAAAQAFEEAIRLSQVEGDLFVQLACASFLADIYVFQGHLSRATEMYRQVLAWSDPGLPQKGTIMAYGGLAHILYERNRPDEAHEYIQSGLEQLDRVGGEYAAFVINRILARLHQTQGNWRHALEILDQAYQRGQNAQVSMVTRQASALRAGLQLARGDLEAALAWAENSGLRPNDAEVDHPGWREIEYLTLARVLAAQGRHEIALSLLERLMKSAQADGRDGSAIGILVLQALFDQAQGNGMQALEHLERALVLAEPEGYARVFVDEGEPMRLLLRECRATVKKQVGSDVDSKSHRLLTYIDKLLAAFSQPAPAEKPGQGVILEPLSERELEVLRLIASGCTNQEIAEKLVIAVSTVKSHINNLYGKLGTNRRTEAIAIARKSGLLSE